jgi:hypothetical protein
MPPRPASGGAGPSGRLHAAVLAATNPGCRPPLIAMRAPLLGTLKRPRKRADSQPGPNTNCIFAGAAGIFAARWVLLEALARRSRCLEALLSVT